MGLPMSVQNFVPIDLVNVEIFLWISEVKFDLLVVLGKSQGITKVIRAHLQYRSHFETSRPT